MALSTVVVRNATRDVSLGDRIEVARSLWARGRGLLGRSALPVGSGLLIVPCNSIHSCFMRFRFDAVFLDRDYRVLHVIHEMAPWRISPIVRHAYAVLELPPGVARAADVQPGDLLVVGS